MIADRFIHYHKWPRGGASVALPWCAEMAIGSGCALDSPIATANLGEISNGAVHGKFVGGLGQGGGESQWLRCMPDPILDFLTHLVPFLSLDLSELQGDP